VDHGIRMAFSGELPFADESALPDVSEVCAKSECSPASSAACASGSGIGCTGALSSIGISMSSCVAVNAANTEAGGGGSERETGALPSPELVCRMLGASVSELAGLGTSLSRKSKLLSSIAASNELGTSQENLVLALLLKPAPKASSPLAWRYTPAPTTYRFRVRPISALPSCLQDYSALTRGLRCLLLRVRREISPDTPGWTKSQRTHDEPSHV
jgi:hypothetical protein